jgi:hypothetical protein
MPYIKQSVTGFSLWRPGFSSRVVNVGFVGTKVEMEKVCLQVFWFSLVNYLSTSAPNSFTCHPGTVNVPFKSNMRSNTAHYLRENSQCFLLLTQGTTANWGIH